MNGLVKVAGKQRSKTFDNKTEAKIWAAGLERHLKKTRQIRYADVARPNALLDIASRI